MKITKQLLDKKVAQLYYGNKKIVSIIYVKPEIYLPKDVPMLAGSKITLVKEGTEIKAKMVYKELAVDITKDIILTEEEKRQRIKKAIAHMVANRLNKFNKAKYKSVIWAIMEENVSEDWECPIEA